MRVARYNYAHQHVGDVQDLSATLATMITTGDHLLGPRVETFERNFARYLGVEHVIGVNSGTDAILLSLMALGIGPGDEVITQANTFHATVAAICLAGAQPVLVDADPVSFLMDQSQVAHAITSRTRAIIPVHLFGKPTPMADLLQLARRHALVLVEDAAQAHGAGRDGCMAGTAGSAGCFSFHPSKNLAAAGDAGAIATNDADLAASLRTRRALGQATQNHHVAVGLNSKLDAIQAHVLDQKLPHLTHWNRARACMAAAYRARLADTTLVFQSVDSDECHVFHLMQVRTPRRDALLNWLTERDIEAAVRYPVPIHLQPAFARLGLAQGMFPVAEVLADELLCLPIRPDLSEDEVDYVSDCIHAFFREE